MHKLIRNTGHYHYKTKLELIHRHYTDVLFDSIKRRCEDAVRLAETCRKLEEFFSALRLVHRIHRHYLRALDLTVAPFRAIKNNHVITVQEALTLAEDPDDLEEFDLRSPMTYKIRLQLFPEVSFYVLLLVVKRRVFYYAEEWYYNYLCR